MKQKKSIPLVLKILFPISILFGILFFAHLLLYDGLDGFVMEHLSDRVDTAYSKNYNEKKFRKIKIGFSKEKVLSMIGEPILKKQFEDGCVWFYSESPSSSSYHVRYIVFAENENVKEIGHSFYID